MFSPYTVCWWSLSPIWEWQRRAGRQKKWQRQRAAAFNQWSRWWIPTSRTVWDWENRSVASSARVFTFFILSHSLSQEMFVHNSGARNVIHLFVLWCRVLQNIDERQSVAKMCVCVSVSKVGGSSGGCGWMRWKESLQDWQWLRQGERQMDTLKGEANGKGTERGREMIQNMAKSMLYT